MRLRLAHDERDDVLQCGDGDTSDSLSYDSLSCDDMNVCYKRDDEYCGVFGAWCV